MSEKVKIAIKQNSNGVLEIEKKEIESGYENENIAHSLEFEFPDFLNEYNKLIEFNLDGKKVYDILQNNTYELKTNVTKHSLVGCQITFTKKIDEENTQVYKTNTFYLEFGESINANLGIDKEDEKEVNALNTLQDSIQTSIDETRENSTRINEQNEKLSNLEYKSEDLQFQIDSTNNYIKNVQTKIDNTDSKLSNIIDIIPNQANEENQLADKDFVNSSIATSTATFRGTFNTFTELKSTNADVNDYGNVITIEEGQTYYNRYTFDGEKWVFNFKINNTTFTAEQWKALNSKATEDLISQISTNKENVEKHEDRIKLLENDNISNKEKIEANTNSILQNNSSIARNEESRTHLYGIRRKIDGNSSSEWERLYDSIGLVANATKDGSEVKNDFDNLSPWNQIISYNINLATKKTTALYGDDNFTFDGSNGDVYTYYPKTWWKLFQKNGYDYILLSDSPRSGFKEMPAFSIAKKYQSI